jgi:group I intron endonuclease
MAYIGKTENNFGDRRDCHFASLDGGYGVNPLLQADWDKYGRESFSFLVLEDCTDGVSSDEINNLEREYIQAFRSNGRAYNIGDGGDSSPWKGKHLSEATKRKIGEKNRVNMLGKKASDETRAKMSESQKKRCSNMTEAEKTAFSERMKIVNTGKVWNDEQRKRFSEMQQIRPNGAKYTVDDVHNIRRMHEIDGMTFTEISNALQIPRHTVYEIATYRRWKSV